MFAVSFLQWVRDEKVWNWLCRIGGSCEGEFVRQSTINNVFDCGEFASTFIVRASSSHSALFHDLSHTALVREHRFRAQLQSPFQDTLASSFQSPHEPTRGAKRFCFPFSISNNSLSLSFLIWGFSYQGFFVVCVGMIKFDWFCVILALSICLMHILGGTFWEALLMFKTCFSTIAF